MVETGLADVVVNVFVEAVTAGGVFFLGAMAGSFLNVLLHRLPRRMNILWPPSHCPNCGQRLALADNIPLFSWLSLRGRCRYCKTSIPARYLLVEAALGGLFLALLYLTLHTGGGNLPLRFPNQYGGALYTIWFPQYDLLAIYGSFCLLGFFLACLALFGGQGDRLPGTLVLTAAALGLLLSWYSPHVQQVPLAGAAGMPTWQRQFGGGAESALGLAAGLGLGGLLGLVSRPRVPCGVEPGPRWGLPARGDQAAILGLAGGWLGWQAAVSSAVLTALALAALPARTPAVVAATGAVGVQLGLWRLLARHAPWWPGPFTAPGVMAGWVGAAVVLALAGSVRSRRAAPPRLPPDTRPETARPAR